MKAAYGNQDKIRAKLLAKQNKEEIKASKSEEAFENDEPFVTDFPDSNLEIEGNPSSVSASLNSERVTKEKRKRQTKANDRMQQSITGFVSKLKKKEEIK